MKSSLRITVNGEPRSELELEVASPITDLEMLSLECRAENGRGSFGPTFLATPRDYRDGAYRFESFTRVPGRPGTYRIDTVRIALNDGDELHSRLTDDVVVEVSLSEGPPRDLPLFAVR